MKHLVTCAALLAAWVAAADSGVWTMSLTDEMRHLAELPAEQRSGTWAASQGGAWSVYSESGVQRPYAEYTNDNQVLVGFYASSYDYFALLANTNASGSAIGGPHSGKVNAGEIYFHPKDNGILAQILYTAPDTGSYSVSGEIRSIGSGGDGVVASVIAGGITYACVTTTANQASAYLFSASFSLWRGEAVTLQLTAHENINFDATALRYAVSRTGALTTWKRSFGAELAALATDTPFVNPVSRPEGAWGVYKRANNVLTAMDTPYVDSFRTAMKGVAFAATGAAYPRLAVNTGNVPCGSTDATHGDVNAGELLSHPAYNVPVVMRFVPAEDGAYTVKAIARNLGGSGGVSSVRLSVGGVELASATVTGCTNGITAVALVSNQCVSAGMAIDIVHDPEGAHSYDATGLSVEIVRQPYETGQRMYSAVDAFREDMKSAEPTAVRYVSRDGGVWSWGTYESGKLLQTTNRFTACSTARAGQGTFYGWRDTATSYPYFMVSTNGVAGRPTSDFQEDVGEYEFGYHPNAKTYGVLRFHAPTAGVYTVWGSFMSMNSSGGDGLDGYVAVGTGTAYPYAGTVCAKSSATVQTEEIWLAADDTVDFVLGPGASRSHVCDAAAAQLFVKRLGAIPDDPYVNIDLVGASRSAYAGAGRIGIAADGAWAKLDLAAGSRRSRRTAWRGTELAVRLEVGKAACGTVADEAAPLADGLLSAGPEDPVAFRVTGLTPQAAYTFHVFGRHASGSHGTFRVADAAYETSSRWFSRYGEDAGTFTATADETGTVTGTFAGTTGAALFAALQITGATFPAYVPNGMTVIIR